MWGFREMALKWLVPSAIVVVGAIAGYLLRRFVHARLAAWAQRTRFAGYDAIAGATGPHLPFLVFAAGLYVALRLSPLSPEVVARADGFLAAAVTISLTWMTASLASGLIKVYAPRYDPGMGIEQAAQQVALVVIVGTGFLFFLSAVGVPPTPVLLVIGIAVLAGAIAMRNVLPDIFAGLSVAVGRQVRRGEKIRLESGEEGVVREIGWRTTTLRTGRGDTVIIPNSRVVSGVLVKMRPGPRLDANLRAAEPFVFHSRLALAELSGLRAATLAELADTLERVPLSSVYYHSLQYVEEHQYLTPTPASDFARWVSDALDYNDLGEVLSFVDPCQCASLAEFRDRLLGPMREYLKARGDERRASPGQEFFFMMSRLFIFPTGRTAANLGELAEGVREATPNSLYFHLFEARLRLGRSQNDFSAWIEAHYGQTDLAARIGRLEPYTYTAEGLRNALAALIEERI